MSFQSVKTAGRISHSPGWPLRVWSADCSGQLWPFVMSCALVKAIDTTNAKSWSRDCTKGHPFWVVFQSYRAVILQTWHKTIEITESDGKLGKLCSHIVRAVKVCCQNQDLTLRIVPSRARTSSWKWDLWVLPFNTLFLMVIDNSCWSFHSKLVDFYQASGRDT